jgi:hypothetical protein
VLGARNASACWRLRPGLPEQAATSDFWRPLRCKVLEHFVSANHSLALKHLTLQLKPEELWSGSAAVHASGEAQKVSCFSRAVSCIKRVPSHLFSAQHSDNSSFSGCTFYVNILVPSPLFVPSCVPRCSHFSQFHHRLESRATQHLPRKGCDKQGTKKRIDNVSIVRLQMWLSTSDSALSTVGVSKRHQLS